MAFHDFLIDTISNFGPLRVALYVILYALQYLLLGLSLIVFLGAVRTYILQHAKAVMRHKGYPVTKDKDKSTSDDLPLWKQGSLTSVGSESTIGNLETTENTPGHKNLFPRLHIFSPPFANDMQQKARKSTTDGAQGDQDKSKNVIDDFGWNIGLDGTWSCLWKRCTQESFWPFVVTVICIYVYFFLGVDVACDHAYRYGMFAVSYVQNLEKWTQVMDWWGNGTTQANATSAWMLSLTESTENLGEKTGNVLTWCTSMFNGLITRITSTWETYTPILVANWEAYAPMLDETKDTMAGKVLEHPIELIILALSGIGLAVSFYTSNHNSSKTEKDPQQTPSEQRQRSEEEPVKEAIETEDSDNPSIKSSSNLVTGNTTEDAATKQDNSGDNDRFHTSYFPHLPADWQERKSSDQFPKAYWSQSSSESRFSHLAKFDSFEGKDTNGNRNDRWGIHEKTQRTSRSSSLPTENTNDAGSHQYFPWQNYNSSTHNGRGISEGTRRASVDIPQRTREMSGVISNSESDAQDENTKTEPASTTTTSHSVGTSSTGMGRGTKVHDEDNEYDAEQYSTNEDGERRNSHDKGSTLESSHSEEQVPPEPSASDVDRDKANYYSGTMFDYLDECANEAWASKSGTGADSKSKQQYSSVRSASYWDSLALSESKSTNAETEHHAHSTVHTRSRSNPIPFDKASEGPMSGQTSLINHFDDVPSPMGFHHRAKTSSSVDRLSVESLGIPKESHPHQSTATTVTARGSGYLGMSSHQSQNNSKTAGSGSSSSPFATSSKITSSSGPEDRACDDLSSEQYHPRMKEKPPTHVNQEGRKNDTFRSGLPPKADKKSLNSHNTEPWKTSDPSGKRGALEASSVSTSKLSSMSAVSMGVVMSHKIVE